MDLGRRSVRELGHYFARVLDGNVSGESASESRQNFVIEDLDQQFERELALLRPGVPSERVPEKLLGSYKSFFEGAICLRLRDQDTFLTSLFLFGESFAPQEPRGTRVDFGLQNIEPQRVYKLSVVPIFRSLGLGTFDRLNGAAAFAFVLSSDTIFILFDNRPHPWQVFAVESAFLSARDTFQRLTHPRTSSRLVQGSPRGFFK